jgi:hypothetical protein
MVLDISLPGGNGFLAAEWLRGLKESDSTTSPRSFVSPLSGDIEPRGGLACAL